MKYGGTFIFLWIVVDRADVRAARETADASATVVQYRCAVHKLLGQKNATDESHSSTN